MQTALDPFSFLVTCIAGLMNQHQHYVINYLIEENRVLREQIGNRRWRFTDDQRRRLPVKAKTLGRKILAQVATVVTPETLMAWHRTLIAKKYDRSAQRTAGRPRTAAEFAALITRMARENRNWGYRRIQGALANLGHLLAHNTIADILKRHGIEPAPERSRKTTWKEFLSSHWNRIVANDFFTIGDGERSKDSRLCNAFSSASQMPTAGRLSPDSIPLGGFTPGVVRYHIIGLLIRHWLTRMSLTNIGHFVHPTSGTGGWWRQTGRRRYQRPPQQLLQSRAIRTAACRSHGRFSSGLLLLQERTFH